MINTTIKISKKTMDDLNKFKIHPRQSYNEVLQLLIIHCREAIKKGDLEIFKK